MALWLPGSTVLVGNPGFQFYNVLQPPIALSVMAPQMDADTETYVGGGRYYESDGVIGGVPLQLRQDTYITGTAGRSGRDFTSVSGTWRDDWVNSQNGYYGLLFPDSTGGMTGEVLAASTTTGIEPCEIVLQKGFPPTGATVQTKTDQYAYIEFANGSQWNWRIAIEYGQPFRIDYTKDSGATWNPVAVCKKLGQAERYLRANNNEIRIALHLDDQRTRLMFEIGDGELLTMVWKDAVEAGESLSTIAGKIRVTTKNGWCAFQYFPARYQPVTVTDNRGIQTPFPIIAPYGGTVKANGLTKDATNQTNAFTAYYDSGFIKYSFNASCSGDSLGGYTQPKVSDATCLFPAVWQQGYPTIDVSGTAYLDNIAVEEEGVWDEASRTVQMFIPEVLCDNSYGQYNGGYGHLAVSIDASNGGPWFNRFVGIGGIDTQGDNAQSGITFTADVTPQGVVRSLMRFACQDKSYLMDVPLGQEVDLDGWALGAAVRFLCECGNTHYDFISDNIPDWDRGPVGDADGCPYYTLPRGTGDNAKLRFYPTQSVWSILRQLCQDSADIDPVTGFIRPFMMGFDPNGIFRFEPVALASSPPVFQYDIWNDEGNIQWITVSNSVSDLRTDLTFQGIEGNTFELMNYNLSLDDTVRAAVGFRYVYMERQSRYASEDYLRYVANVAAFQCSLPTQWVTIQVPFQPIVQPGANVLIYHEDSGIGGQYNVKRMHSRYGFDGSMSNPHPDCYSILTCRASIKDL